MRRLYKNEPPTSPLISSAKIPIPHRLLCKPGRYWTVDCNICFCTHQRYFLQYLYLIGCFANREDIGQ
ncbi:Pacifastin inhibitor (LCMII) [Popillia japonica]|uniref:Pacifastin inhibitor (LCMII) n=1 Tax=Popillia japonica TaxID=7064 RepID=A0AAW1IER8_POPJA